MGEPVAIENNWRSTLAKRILGMRDSERKGYIVNNREAYEYIDILLGLQHLFEYVKTNVKVGRLRLVADLGAGNTKAISQLAKAEYCQSLVLEATGLTPHEDILRHLGSDKLHLITFESLSCFKPGSLGAAISVFGEGYATNPERAMEKLDEKLASGGVFKANFQHPDNMTPQLEFTTHDRFSKKLQQLGYDVAVVDSAPKHESQILVAIKQPVNITAQELIDQDCVDYKKQVEAMIALNRTK